MKCNGLDLDYRAWFGLSGLALFDFQGYVGLDWTWDLDVGLYVLCTWWHIIGLGSLY